MKKNNDIIKKEPLFSYFISDGEKTKISQWELEHTSSGTYLSFIAEKYVPRVWVGLDFVVVNDQVANGTFKLTTIKMIENNTWIKYTASLVGDLVWKKL